MISLPYEIKETQLNNSTDHPHQSEFQKSSLPKATSRTNLKKIKEKHQLKWNRTDDCIISNQVQSNQWGAWKCNNNAMEKKDIQWRERRHHRRERERGRIRGRKSFGDLQRSNRRNWCRPDLYLVYLLRSSSSLIF